MNNNWFESRSLRVLNYQQDAITKVQESMEQREITVLAAAPSAGKTLMTIYIIEEYLKQNPNHKVLVLAHGTTILRTQFHDVLEEIKPDFSFNLVEKFTDYDGSDVNVCLPQTLAGNDLNKIDLLIVDEAHQFYFAEKMMKEIIKQTKPKKQLLLTGTPSPFIRKGFKIIPVTLNTIFDEGMITDLFVEIATSSYSFDPMYDFNPNTDELKSSVHIKESETKKTLDDLIGKIVDRLRSIKDNPYQNLLPEWLPTLKKLQKTMIACRSQHQAMQVKSYFDKIGVTSALSISDVDYDSKEIERFKNEPNCLILIVVGRGILGFNYPELVNVVDMTTSQNVDRIYQLLCRVIRKHPDGHNKLFFKVAPNIHSDYYKYIMTAVLSLADETFFTKFNGKNFSDMIIPVIKTKREHHEPNNNGGSKPRPKTLKPIDFEGLPVFEFFKDLYHKKDALLHIYAYTTVRDVRAEFLKQMPSGCWTFEKCLESALVYDRPVDWQKNDLGAYSAAFKNNWIADCTKHMTKREQLPSGYWTKEKCLESALKYNTINEWNKNECTALSVARKNKWLDECTAHMKRLHEIWTKDKCIESAQRHTKIISWMKSSPNAYQAACNNGWKDECVAHMTKTRKNWTKEMCLESAKPFNKLTDWFKICPDAVAAAKRLNCHDECTEHMERRKKCKDKVKPMGYWTKEKCIEDALNYTSIRDWRKNGNSACQVARKNGWYDECIKHMSRLQLPNGYWTKERCIEDALNYTSVTKWQKNGGGSFSAARKNGWYDDCVKHMTRPPHWNLKWTKEKCIEDALKYTRPSDWQYSSGGAYSTARKNGWLNECCSHMTKRKKSVLI